MIRICHVITRMILGGAQENTLLTLQGLKRDTSWEIHLAYGPETGGEGSLVEAAREAGVTLHPLRFMRRNLHPVDDARAWFELREYFARERFDLVHTHSSKAGVLGRLAARQAGVPRVVHTIHGLAFDEYQPAWRNWIYAAAERIAAARSDAIIAVCETMARQARAAGAGNAAAMRVIYSGFALEPFLAVRPRVPDGRFRIGMIARMFPFKGHEDLMELAPGVLERWEDAEFLIVGDGPFRGQWEAWLEAHPALRGRIQLAGRVEPAQVPAQLERMDLLLHLSWREGLARTIPQALAAGRPVCVYDIGGAGEVVRPGETGWLAAPRDREGVRRAIAEVRADGEGARRMAERGREEVRRKFGVEVMQREILRLYTDLGMGKGGKAED